MIAFRRKLNKAKAPKLQTGTPNKENAVTHAYQEEIVQRITKNLLDIQLLRLIQAQPSIWGYRIKKTVETEFHVKLGHGALYPTLNSLEQRGFLASRKQREGGRARKVYTVTAEGERYLQCYYEILREQLKSSESS
jgi:DNA-binding PadR family transcriptional regulator